jgi:hypothetical protein
MLRGLGTREDGGTICERHKGIEVRVLGLLLDAFFGEPG